jgi:hypothetical protein
MGLLGTIGKAALGAVGGALGGGKGGAIGGAIGGLLGKGGNRGHHGVPGGGTFDGMPKGGGRISQDPESGVISHKGQAVSTPTFVSPRHAGGEYQASTRSATKKMSSGRSFTRR